MMLSVRAENIKPYLYQFLGRLLPQFVGIGITSVIVKNAGIDVFGQYSLLIAMVTIAFGVVGTAMDTDFQRSCNAGKIFEVLSVKLFVWFLLVPILWLLAWIANLSWAALLMVAFAILLRQFVETIVTQYRIEGNDKKAVLPRLIPVVVFLMLLLIFRPATQFGVSVTFSFSWLVGIIFLHKSFYGIRINPTKMLRLLHNVTPLWLSLLLTQVYGNVDLYIVKMFHGDYAVGIYKASFTFAAMSIPVAGVFSYIFLSNISSAVRFKDFVTMKVSIINQLMLCGFLGVGLIAFMIFIFPSVAKFLYGEVGEKMVLTAILLSIAMALNMFTMVFSYSLLAFRMEKLIALMTAIGAVVYIGIGIPLIQKYGAEGAGVAMLITYCLLLLSYVWTFQRRFVLEKTTCMRLPL